MCGFPKSGYFLGGPHTKYFSPFGVCVGVPRCRETTHIAIWPALAPLGGSEAKAVSSRFQRFTESCGHLSVSQRQFDLTLPSQDRTSRIMPEICGLHLPRGKDA